MRLLSAALLLVLGLWSWPALAQSWLPGGTGIPIVCAYNASPATVATGTFVYAQCNSSGSLLSSGSSGGGAVTLASGAVASGAYSSGSIAAGAFSSGSFVAAALADGAITTMGTEADAAWVSGSGTEIAILKAIAAIAATPTISGSVTANAGSNLNTSALALEAGGHLANIDTNTSSAIPAGTNIIGYTSNDPCSYATKLSLPISANATALTQIIAASGSTKIYVCSISLIAAGATAYNLNTGTASNCASSTAALLGSTTAANGLSFAANGGLTMGDGHGSILVTAASSEICTLQSNAVFVSGSMTYVQQ